MYFGDLWLHQGIEQRAKRGQTNIGNERTKHTDIKYFCGQAVG